MLQTQTLLLPYQRTTVNMLSTSLLSGKQLHKSLSCHERYFKIEVKLSSE